MPNQETSKLRLQIKFNWKAALCVLILFPILIGLGFWQLDRAEQKRQIQSDFDAKRLAIPVPLGSLSLDNIKTLNQLKVSLDGRYNNDKSILVSNQVFNGRPGYEIITAFVMDASDSIVLVGRGWIPTRYGSKQLPTIKPVTGTQQLVGAIYVPSSKSFFLPQKFDEPPTWPLHLHHFDINSISPLFNKPVLPFVVRLDQNNSGVFERHWKITRLNATNSTSYALQWFGMALILVVITIIKSTNILEIIRSKKSIR